MRLFVFIILVLSFLQCQTKSKLGINWELSTDKVTKQLREMFIFYNSLYGKYEVAQKKQLLIENYLNYLSDQQNIGIAQEQLEQLVNYFEQQFIEIHNYYQNTQPFKDDKYVPDNSYEYWSIIKYFLWPIYIIGGIFIYNLIYYCIIDFKAKFKKE